MSQKSQDKPAGNTKTAKQNSNQLYLWMITLKANEPEITTAEELHEKLASFCKRFTFQKEKGKETGFIHWQIFISLKQKEYFGTVKNLFPSSAHIEPCKNGWKAAKYCEKDETRIEGPYTENSTFLKTIKDLYPWQQKLEKLLLTEPDDRTINWYWDKHGNIGKTKFCKHMIIKHNATVLNNGAFKDIAQALPEAPKIVLFNITRDNEERINYSALEAVKDGLIFSGKYESHTKVFNSPHVVVFANFEPRKESMSLDRWNIVNLSEE